MLVYNIDRWSRYLWRRFVDQSSEAQSLVKRAEGRLPNFAEFMNEVFVRLYAHHPKSLDKVLPENDWAAQIHQQLDQLPDFARMRQRCRGDRLLAGEATVALARDLPLPEEALTDPEPLRQEVRGLLKFGLDAERVRDKGKRAVARARAWAQAQDLSKLRGRLRAGIAAGRQGVDETELALAAFGDWGTSGSVHHAASATVKAELSRRIRDSPKLQQLAQQAGRLRRIAARKQGGKVKRAGGEVCDIEMGHALQQLLPAELMKIGHPLLGLDFARRYQERSLLQYKLQSQESQGRGPIIVCLDQSSSMHGDKEVWSKALALALLDIAGRQKRHCRVIHFNAGIVRIDDWPAGQVEPLGLLKSMEDFAGGGTNFEPPLQAALDAIDRDMQKADVVMVTDGQARVSEDFLRQWNQARKRFHSYAIHVDSASPPPELCDLADTVVAMSDVAKDSAATEAVFDI